MKLVNKIIKNTGIYSCIFILGSLVSCGDYLKDELYGVSTVEQFYKTPIDAEQALSSAYAPMNKTYAGWGELWSSDLFLGDIGTDDVLKGGLSDSDQLQLVEKETYTLTAENSYWDIRWQLNYRGVLYANLVLTNIADVEFEDQDRKKEILAEAHFLRAFYYFSLVRMFGGVPLYDKPVSLKEVNIPRATTEETYTFIENDLKKSIEDLPSRFDKSSMLGRADKGAALGLMMRVCLYQNKMSEVKKYGEQLFDLPYSLPELNNIFHPDAEWGTGSVFEVNYSTTTDKLGSSAPRMMMPRTKKDKGFGFSQIKKDVVDAYDANDPRLEAYIYTAIKAPNENLYETGYYNRKFSWDPYCSYAKPAIGGLLNSDVNVRIIRLADVYLMYAEAIYQDDPATAITYVNKVRQRARGEQPADVLPDLDPTLTGDALRDAIYLERRLELVGEGLRFYDLVRTNRAEAVLGTLGFEKGTHEVMPLPSTQVDLSNGVLKQNPNY